MGAPLGSDQTGLRPPGELGFLRTADALWKSFEATGSIIFYLLYRRILAAARESLN